MNEEQTQAPVEEVVNTQPAGVTEIAPKKSRLWLKILIPILIVLVLGGVGASAYYFFFAVDYEAALTETFANMENVKSGHYNYYIEMSASAQDQTIDSQMQLSGDYLMKDDNKLDFSTELLTSNDIGISSSDSENVELGASIYYVDEKVYFKLTQLPDIAEMAMFDLSPLTENWVTVDIKSLKDQLGYDDLILNFEENNLESSNDQRKKEEEYLQVLLDNWQSLAQKNQLFIIDSVETVKENGTKMYVYSLTLDKTKIIPFIEDFGELIGETLQDDRKAELEERFAMLDSNNITIKIDPKNNYLHQVSINVKLSGDSELETADVKFVIDLTKQNQIEKIDVPEGEMIDLNYLMNEMMGGMTGGGIGLSDAPIPEGDITNMMSYQVENELDMDSDNDGINDFYERNFYSTDPNKADTDGDGYNDFQEIEAGYSPLGEGESMDYLSIFPADMDFCTVLVGPFIEQVDIKDPNKLVEQIFEELMEIEQTAMPMGLKLNGSKVDQGALWLDFSSEYGEMVDPCLISAAQEQIKMSFGQIGKSMQILITSDMQYQTVLY